MLTVKNASTVFRIALSRRPVVEVYRRGTTPTAARLRRCYCEQQPRSGDGSANDARRYKLAKRLFSTVLFGGTLAAALYFKRRRQAEHNELFRECVMLPRDDNYAPNMYFYNYRGYVFPGMVIRSLPRVQALKARPDDIYVVSFPKTGTTWVQEIVYLIVTGLDFRSAAARNMEQRFPFLEYFYPGVSTIENSPDTRMIKTHLPYSLLPESIHTENPKIIYIMRNPKDVCVSLYHFTRLIKETGYEGSFKDFFESFLKGHVSYGPIWKHYLEWWEHRNDPNVLVITYEDLHKDACSVIQRIAIFLGRPLRDDEVTAIAEHCHFSHMAHNPAANYEHWRKLGFVNLQEGGFMRKGIVGDWKNYFTPDMNAQMDAWLEEKFGSTDLSFVYELPPDELAEKDSI
uniref:Putative sulfotransferase n=1 Tax=Hyalomma excavatum TaxID=257692 RepID=A0A131XEK4_9ACAR